MRIGIVTPVLIQHPQTRSEWEATAGIVEVARIAEVADRLGYHHLTCSEHVAIPTAIARERGATYWDPLSTFGYLAARTARIRLTTQVLVLGYHHPLEVAKRYGTLDQISGESIGVVGHVVLTDRWHRSRRRVAARVPSWHAVGRRNGPRRARRYSR